MKKHLILSLLLMFTAFACGDVAEEIEETNICDTASEHLATCGLTETPLSSDCAPNDANEILALSCADLANPGKADLFSDVLCRIGVLFMCEVGQCPVAEPDGFTDWDPDGCGSYIAEPSDSDCGSCDYYRCRNAISEQTCDGDNYYLDFGNRYCLRFAQLTEEKLSEEGQLWSQRIRTCLMNFAEANIENDDTCVDVQMEAIDSHTDCYVSTGFCELPVRDWIKVLATVGPGDFAFKSAVVTAISCVKKYSDENPGVIENL